MLFEASRLSINKNLRTDILLCVENGGRNNSL